MILVSSQIKERYPCLSRIVAYQKHLIDQQGNNKLRHLRRAKPANPMAGPMFSRDCHIYNINMCIFSVHQHFVGATILESRYVVLVELHML